MNPDLSLSFNVAWLNRALAVQGPLLLSTSNTSVLRQTITNMNGYNMTKYLIDTISTHRLRYVVEATSEHAAVAEVKKNIEGNFNDEFLEFSQQHLGELVAASRPITTEEYLELFDIDNGYLNTWPEEQKFVFVNILDETV